MRVTILTDNKNSWVIPYAIQLFNELRERGIDVTHIYKKEDIPKGGDLLVLLSCETIIGEEFLKRNKSNIVAHPSKLPHGKGWSPLAWQILDGKNLIPITLFEASIKVDDGPIYLLDYIELEGHELNDEIKSKQGIKTIEMVLKYISDFNNRIAIPQEGQSTFYPKRDKNSSELDLNKTINEQFNLLRVVDNEKYPAFFLKDGVKYFLKISKESK